MRDLSVEEIEALAVELAGLVLARLEARKAVSTAEDELQRRRTASEEERVKLWRLVQDIRGEAEDEYRKILAAAGISGRDLLMISRP